VERSISVMRRHLLFVFSVLLLCNIVGVASADGKKVVLVASAHLKHLSLTRVEVRQLFLGGSIKKNDTRLVPVINDIDPLLYEIFLQKIVFMSARTYERRLISRILHKGGQRIQFSSKLVSFENSLATEPGRITFMWESKAHTLPGIVVIEELWPGSVN